MLRLPLNWNRVETALELSAWHDSLPVIEFTGLALVFHGWETVFCDAVA